MANKPKPKTLLFFPVEIGLAHVCRSLAIAEELHARGHRVLFAIAKRKQKVFAQSPVEFIDVEEYVSDDDFGMNVKLFRDTAYIERTVGSELKIIDTYHPDAAIVDFRVSAFAATTLRNIKTYAIFVGDGLPYGALLPNPGMPALLYRMFKRMFPVLYDLATRWYLEPFLHYMRRKGRSISFDQWMQGIEYFVPEPADYMPAVSKAIQVHHVGSLSWYKFNNTVPPWLESIHPDGKTIYLSFGGTGFDKKKPIELSTALLDAGYRVIVSTGRISNPADYPTHPHLFVEQFLPGDKISSKVDLVLCHGGYGTMMDAIQHHVPVLAIPFNPDQILHAARMQELGVARSMFKLSFHDLYAVFTFKWARIEDKGKRVKTQDVLTAVKEMFANRAKYKQALHDFNTTFQTESGAHRAADIIERNLIRDGSTNITSSDSEAS